MAKQRGLEHPRPWTKEEVRHLEAHSKARTPVSEVAKAMKRSVGAVRHKAVTVGIGLGHHRRQQDGGVS